MQINYSNLSSTKFSQLVKQVNAKAESKRMILKAKFYLKRQANETATFVALFIRVFMANHFGLNWNAFLTGFNRNCWIISKHRWHLGGCVGKSIIYSSLCWWEIVNMVHVHT
jgi:hypothetical protein